MIAAAATSAPEPQADAWEAAEAQARAVAQRQLQVLGPIPSSPALAGERTHRAERSEERVGVGAGRIPHTSASKT